MWLAQIFLLLLFATVESLRLDECASTALGMETGAIPDSKIMASTSFDNQSLGPQNARIRSELGSGAWCPKPQIHAGSYEFLQINLDRTYVITAVETQGRYGNGTGREFVNEYMIDYLRAGSKWIRYKNRTSHTLMTGNTDTTTAILRQLDPPIVASRIRLVPYSKSMQPRTMCIRAELHGCVQKDGLMYYSTIPEGSHTVGGDFRDHVFEETELETRIDGYPFAFKKGLGLLSDGFVADASPYESEKNSSFVGWNKALTGGEVKLLFEFDQLRNFTEILLAAYGHRLNSIDAIFSQDGSHYPLSSQISSLDPQAANSTITRYDLKIPLHKRMAKKVQVSLRFSGDWFFLTEVHFESGSLSYLPESDIFGSAVISNETIYTTSEEEIPFERSNVFSILGLTLLFIVLTTVLCGVLCMRRRGDDGEKERPVDMRKDLIITQVAGGKPQCNVYPSQQFYYGNQYASDKTTTTSLSSKSTTSKHSPPSWNDFHFPPPPETPSPAVAVEEERIYAEPCMTLPLLPSQRTPKKQNSNRSPPQHRSFNSNSLHYATGHAFNELSGFENIEKFSSSALQLGPDIGEGKFTVVRECVLPGGRRVAHKCTKDRNNLHARTALLDELRALAASHHPHVVCLIGMDENASILMERVPLGDARHFLKNTEDPLSLHSILAITADVCAGMMHLESLGVVHGHLSPSNVLLDERLRAKVCSPRGPAHHAQLRYSAPESILLNQFSSQSDCWAYSVSVWEMVEHCNRLPYQGMSNAELVENAEKIIAGNQHVMIPRFPDRTPRPLSDILTRCFHSEPRSRPSFAQIYHFLERYHSISLEY